MYISGKDARARVTEPPILRGLSTSEILRFRDRPLRTKFLNHQQPVERMVALMSRCAQQVVGEDRQAAQQIATEIFRGSHPSRKRKLKRQRAAAAVNKAKRHKNTT